MKKIVLSTFQLTYKMTEFMEKKKKTDIPDENLSASTNKMSRKLMVSAAISWYGATKPFCERKWY